MYRLLSVFLLLSLLALSACSGPMTQAQRKRVDSCLKRCGTQSVPAPPSEGDWNRTHGSYDKRTACERSCHGQ